MQKQGYCARSHDNGFKHLNAVLSGLEEEYDLGYKFDDEKRATLPYRPLYVSVRHRSKESVHGEHLPVLHYRLAGTDDKEDQGRLLDRALPYIKADIAAIHSGDRPSHLDRERPKRLRR